MKIKGGSPLYGEAIGILLLDGGIPRVPGDIGNAGTFPFPVRYKVVRDVDITNVKQGLGEAELNKFIAAAQELEHEGCRAITTSCGFLGAYQKQIASAVGIPVYTSSLMQVGFVYSMLPAGKKVGGITSSTDNMTPALLEAVGIAHIPMEIEGLNGSPSFIAMHSSDPTLDMDALREEMLDAARKLVERAPDVGALVFECTNMPPYSLDVQEATGLPVFDIVTLTHYLYHAVVQTQYRKPLGRL